MAFRRSWASEKCRFAYRGKTVTQEAAVKSLSEKINWYREPETRKWKRIWHSVELSLISLSEIVVLVTVQIYGNGTNFQVVFTLFTLIIALCSALLVPAFYQSNSFQRWHIRLVTASFVCGAGISSLAGFLILEMQHASTQHSYDRSLSLVHD